VATAIGGVRPSPEQVAPLELIEQRDEVARLNPQRRCQVALGGRPLRVEVVEHGELRPAQPALAKTAPQAPG
jgi:hypothetical protein